MGVKFGRLNKLPAYKILSDTILAEIMAGRVRQGDQLPTESELCEQFGVNRSTVREGVRVLEEAGVLSRERGKRFTISRPSQGQISTHLQRAMVLHEITFNELWEAVMTIEPPMAKLAAARTDEKLLRDVDSNLQRTEQALADGGPLVELDIEFHDLIASATGNAALRLSREPLVQLFYPAFGAVFASVPSAGERLLVAHREIARAMRDGDADLIEIWTGRHLRDFKRGLEAAGVDLSAPITASHESAPHAA